MAPVRRLLLPTLTCHHARARMGEKVCERRAWQQGHPGTRKGTTRKGQTRESAIHKRTNTFPVHYHSGVGNKLASCPIPARGVSRRVHRAATRTLPTPAPRARRTYSFGPSLGCLAPLPTSTKQGPAATVASATPAVRALRSSQASPSPTSRQHTDTWPSLFRANPRAPKSKKRPVAVPMNKTTENIHTQRYEQAPAPRLHAAPHTRPLGPAGADRARRRVRHPAASTLSPKRPQKCRWVGRARPRRSLLLLCTAEGMAPTVAGMAPTVSGIFRRHRFSNTNYKGKNENITTDKILLTHPHTCTKRPFEACRPPPPDHTWHLTHAAWNLLRRIEHGNTSATPRDAHALRKGHKIAVWWEEPDPTVPSCWYTAKVIDPAPERHTQHTVKYDRDNTVYTHDFMPRHLQHAVGPRTRWAPALPTYTPPCPKCGSATRGGTGASIGRLSYACDTCETRCTCRDPSALARTDPSTPRVTEDASIKLAHARAPKKPPAPQPQATRRSSRLAALPPDAGGQAAAAAQMLAAGAAAPPPPPPRPSAYREGAVHGPCVADAVLTYHNTNSPPRRPHYTGPANNTASSPPTPHQL